MIDASKCKKTAREQLNGRWSAPIAVSIVCILIYSGVGYMNKTMLSSSLVKGSNLNFLLEIATYAIIGIVIQAAAYFYLKMSRTSGPMGFSDFLVGLGDYWLSGILGFLWFTLWTALWAILFVIPGIVKAISYSMMFCVIAENPGISVGKAMNISKAMTFGHKSELFVLAASFIGWLILCLATGGIGFIWLSPYMSLSFTNAYTELKMEAIKRGALTPSDFNE